MGKGSFTMAFLLFLRYVQVSLLITGAITIAAFGNISLYTTKRKKGQCALAVTLMSDLLVLAASTTATTVRGRTK